MMTSTQTSELRLLKTSERGRTRARPPEELTGVELILHGKEAPTAKAFTGRARAEGEAQREE